MLDLRGPVAGPELLVELDRSGELPLHEQLERSLRENIRSGRLPAGTRLPSTRGLAAELGVSRGVVTEAYGQLGAEGYLETRQGATVRVAMAVRAAVPRAGARSLLPSFPYHFHPGLPDLAASPATAGFARCAPPWASRRLTPWATATRVACPSCAKRSPTTSGAYVARAPTRRT